MHLPEKRHGATRRCVAPAPCHANTCLLRSCSCSCSPPPSQTFPPHAGNNELSGSRNCCAMGLDKVEAVTTGSECSQRINRITVNGAPKAVSYALYEDVWKPRGSNGYPRVPVIKVGGKGKSGAQPAYKLAAAAAGPTGPMTVTACSPSLMPPTCASSSLTSCLNLPHQPRSLALATRLTTARLPPCASTCPPAATWRTCLARTSGWVPHACMTQHQKHVSFVCACGV